MYPISGNFLLLFFVNSTANWVWSLSDLLLFLLSISAKVISILIFSSSSVLKQKVL